MKREFTSEFSFDFVRVFKDMESQQVLNEQVGQETGDVKEVMETGTVLTADTSLDSCM